MQKKTTILDKLNKLLSIIGSAILMNLLFLVACLPVVTIGQAWCGLMGAMRYQIRGDRWIDGFKKGFTTRFLRGTVIWIITAVAFFFVLGDLNAAVRANDTVTLISSALMCCFVAMIAHSALALNVYIYTSVSDWIKNIVNLICKVPVQMLLTAAMLWGLPAALLVGLAFIPMDGLVVWLLLEASVVFFCAYFALAAAVTTMALKGGLIAVLIDCRADGLIIEEEGSMPIQEEDEDDE